MRASTLLIHNYRGIILVAFGSYLVYSVVWAALTISTLLAFYSFQGYAKHIVFFMLFFSFFWTGQGPSLSFSSFDPIQFEITDNLAIHSFIHSFIHSAIHSFDRFADGWNVKSGQECAAHDCRRSDRDVVFSSSKRCSLPKECRL